MHPRDEGTGACEKLDELIAQIRIDALGTPIQKGRLLDALKEIRTYWRRFSRDYDLMLRSVGQPEEVDS